MKVSNRIRLLPFPLHFSSSLPNIVYVSIWCSCIVVYSLGHMAIVLFLLGAKEKECIKRGLCMHVMCMSVCVTYVGVGPFVFKYRQQFKLFKTKTQVKLAHTLPPAHTSTHASQTHTRSQSWPEGISSIALHYQSRIWVVLLALAHLLSIAVGLRQAKLLMHACIKVHVGNHALNIQISQVLPGQ